MVRRDTEISFDKLHEVELHSANAMTCHADRLEILTQLTVTIISSETTDTLFLDKRVLIPTAAGI